ncbi:MAG: class I tRNA ligase family protein, partial [Acidimicrobiales bacterium]|nr:class I tRNA ligase family protein [Acidimicrobiales bacterium]
MSRFYMTTPIYYVNDAPHIGHAYTTLNGDAVTRWHRLLGDEVMYLTGTDEHGLKVARAAEKNGLTPREQADRTSERFREAWAELDVANDDFIRTTEERHYRSVQQFLQTAYDNGHIYRDTYEGWYSVSDEAYVTQADVDAGTAGQVEWMREDNYFFRLSAFQDRLLEWYERVPDNVTPEGYRKEALGIIRQGLTDLSISRTSIDWGIPVPWDPDHVFYVWYDALINYAT